MKNLIRPIYNNTIRKYLPYKYQILNGVAVRRARLFDSTNVVIDYKQGLAELIRKHVDDNDTVIEIGGGRGVMTVIAARQGAEVHTYEAAKNMMNLIEDTLYTNRVEENVTTHHAIVGEAVDTLGKPDGAKKTLPKELPSCDVMIFDARGAEISILKNLSEKPQAIIIEPHPSLDAPIDKSKDILSSKGYDLKDKIKQNNRSDIYSYYFELN